MRSVDDGTEPVERKVVFERVAQDAVVPLSNDRCAAVHTDDGRRQETVVLQLVLRAAHGRVSDHLLHVEPRLCVQVVSFTAERLLDSGTRVDPRALQVAQHRLEVLAVVSLRVVLVLPRLEPFTHLRRLCLDRLKFEHGWRHGREGDVLHEVVRLLRSVRHPEKVVVVPRPSNHTVRYRIIMIPNTYVLLYLKRYSKLKIYLMVISISRSQKDITNINEQ